VTSVGAFDRWAAENVGVLQIKESLLLKSAARHVAQSRQMTKSVNFKHRKLETKGVG